jgi:uncharacterized protein YhaN
VEGEVLILRSVRIRGYGCLRDRAFPDLTRLVVVHGPNEAGKTTLRRFVRDLLYGFDPANLEDHPYAPWDGGEMGGEAEIERHSGERVVLGRRLLSAPNGTLQCGARAEKIQNRPLSGLGAVTRKIFEHVYSLDREDLEFPAETWGEVKDRLLGAAGFAEIRPAREVSEELEAEANALWRAKRKAGSAAAKLQDEIRELGRRMQDAEKRDLEIREKEDEIASLEAEKTRLEEEKVEVDARLRRATRIESFRKRVEEIRKDEERAGDAGVLAAFPDDVERAARDQGERSASLAASLEKARAERARLVRDVEAFGGARAEALRRADEVRGAILSGGSLARERRDLENLRGEVARKEGALQERARLVLEDLGALSSILQVSSAETAERIRAYRKARERRIEAGAREGAARAASPLSPLRAALIPGVLGIALAAVAFASPPGSVRTALLAAGGALVLVGLALGLWASVLRRRAMGAGGAATRGESLSAAREEERARLAAVRGLLAPAKVLPSRLEDPDEFLANEIAELERGWKEREAERARIAAAEARLVAAEKGILSLARDLSLEASGAEEAVRGIERLLEEAKEAERARSLAAARLPALGDEIRVLEEGAARVGAEKETLERSLLDLGAGDLAGCVASVRERKEAARRARETREALAREGADFDALAAEIGSVSDGDAARESSDEAIVRLEKRSKEIEEALRAGGEKRAALGKEAEYLRDQPGRADIEGEREALNEEHREVCARHDRLVLLAGIVRESDRRYRAEHEPDIVSRAAEILSEVTGGRHASLHLAEDGNGLEVDAHGPGGPVSAGTPISRGTLDQLFLSLRVALVDHLEGGGESLPLFLDDVLLHWDEERRDRGLEVLRRVAERRQVFLLTCRLDLAGWARGAGGTVVKLPGPGR